MDNKNQYDKTSPFYFDGSMTESVLRRYVSRAVTHQMLCVNDPLFEEDLRMVQNVGAKSVSYTHLVRAGLYSDT